MARIFNQYSVAYGVISARFHTFIIGLRPATRLMISSCRVVTALALITRAPPYIYRLVRRLVFAPCIIGFRLTTPLSQAPLLGQDELTRRKRNLDTRGLSVRLHTLHFYPHHTIITIKQIIETSEFAISRSYREVKQLRITDRNSSVR